eukprot:3695567-Amphidinium_carterae.1
MHSSSAAVQCCLSTCRTLLVESALLQMAGEPQKQGARALLAAGLPVNEDENAKFESHKRADLDRGQDACHRTAIADSSNRKSSPRKALCAQLLLMTRQSPRCHQ